ncbi:MAG TPA: low molecular weight protein-tyrosine-phosphatase [Ignavibacteriaceae bacterium]|nr:low molecular weight protein-tyrosine-phosphatase [Ignavibacteriaceae bacterium]
MKKILFVCLGNICRSPAAEGIMRHLVEKEGLQEKILVDSAGTIDYHLGELPDARIIRHSGIRGYKLNHKARIFSLKDFEHFDYIIAMDDENMIDIKSFDPEEKYSEKILKITDFCTRVKSDEVPDPFYGGPKDFELVLDILEDACKGLIGKLKDEA